MIKRAVTVGSCFPAVVFSLLAALMLARLLVGILPSSPASWAVFMMLAPVTRGISAYVPAHTFLEVVASVAVFAGLAALSAYVLLKRPDWQRASFILAHGAFLAVLFSMNEQRVFSASVAGPGYGGRVSWLPNLGAAHPLTLVLFAGVCVACLAVHRRMIWKARHPVRKIA